MKIISNERVLDIVEQIKNVETMIGKLGKRHDLPAIQFSIEQFEDMKRDFVKQLLAELLQSQHNIADMEPFIHHATSYLKKFDRKENKAGDLKRNLKEVERMIAGA